MQQFEGTRESRPRFADTTYKEETRDSYISLFRIGLSALFILLAGLGIYWYSHQGKIPPTVDPKPTVASENNEPEPTRSNYP